MSTNNVVASNERRLFFVWIDPSDRLTRMQIEGAGCFASLPPEIAPECLMFLPNPNFRSAISPFQNNVVRNYIAEYNLELKRERTFQNYPSRLRCVFLFGSEADANSYRNLHPEHVGGRVLKPVATVGPYVFSSHDGSWVDFLRLQQSLDPNSIEAVTTCYWSGRRVCDEKLESWGATWTQDPISEVLFAGRVDFEDRTLAG